MGLFDFLSILGLFIGVTSFILVFVFRSVDTQKSIVLFESKFERMQDEMNSILDKSGQVISHFEHATSSHFTRPDISIYLTENWEFLRKTLFHRVLKERICAAIVRECIQDYDKILLDSGSTVDLITSVLAGSPIKNVRIFSNSIAAALHLIGSDKIQFYLFDGEFNDQYAAVYSRDGLDKLKEIRVNKIIMAATAIRFKEGIMVDKDDENNASFKKTMLDCFERYPDSELFIAVDPTKFVLALDKHKKIMEEDEWKSILARNSRRMKIITCAPPYDSSDEERIQIREEIDKFKMNTHIEVLELLSNQT